MDLAGDLGLDSLDNAELITFLDDQYDVSGVPVNELTTVGKVMAFAAKQVSFGEASRRRASQSFAKWNKPRAHRKSVSCCREDNSRSFSQLLSKNG